MTEQILSKVVTFILVLVIYVFIFVIIRMIYMDIRAMYRKKSGGMADAYLKLINLRRDLDFYVDESYEISESEIIIFLQKTVVFSNTGESSIWKIWTVPMVHILMGNF